jgi:hypothetical protein
MRGTGARIEVASASSQGTEDAENALALLLDALEDPGSIHPGLAALVAGHARGLLLRDDPNSSLRGTAFNGRITAIDGLPVPVGGEHRRQLL